MCSEESIEVLGNRKKLVKQFVIHYHKLIIDLCSVHNVDNLVDWLLPTCHALMLTTVLSKKKSIAKHMDYIIVLHLPQSILKLLHHYNADIKVCPA